MTAGRALVYFLDFCNKMTYSKLHQNAIQRSDILHGRVENYLHFWSLHGWLLRHVFTGTPVLPHIH